MSASRRAKRTALGRTADIGPPSTPSAVAANSSLSATNRRFASGVSVTTDGPASGSKGTSRRKSSASANRASASGDSSASLHRGIALGGDANMIRAAMPDPTKAGSLRVARRTSGWMPPVTATNDRSTSMSRGSPVRRWTRSGPASYRLSQLGTSVPPAWPLYRQNEPNQPSSSSRMVTIPRRDSARTSASRSMVMSITANRSRTGRTGRSAGSFSSWSFHARVAAMNWASSAWYRCFIRVSMLNASRSVGRADGLLPVPLSPTVQAQSAGTSTNFRLGETAIAAPAAAPATTSAGRAAKAGSAGIDAASWATYSRRTGASAATGNGRYSGTVGRAAGGGPFDFTWAGGDSTLVAAKCRARSVPRADHGAVSRAGSVSQARTSFAPAGG